MTFLQRRQLIAAVLVIANALAVMAVKGGGEEEPIVIGKVDTTATPLPTLAPKTSKPVSRGGPELWRADGLGPGEPIPFNGAVNVPGDLLFFAVIGSDARPGQDVLRSHADSIHIAAVDPLTRKGTVLGIPRDSVVNIPGHGKQKVTQSLAYGGPELAVRTLRDLTGFPISYYAVIGFEGFVKISKEISGLDVKVPYRMNDVYSGARFEPGWHHMTGQQTLAFSRARHGVPGGDIGRSENQGRVIIHALEKLRSKTKDAGGIKKWVEILFRHARLDLSIGEAVRLGVLARHLAPTDLRNVVAQGSPTSMSGQSVVVLNDSAYQLFKDVGADAEADGNKVRDIPETPSPTPMPSASPL